MVANMAEKAKPGDTIQITSTLSAYKGEKFVVIKPSRKPKNPYDEYWTWVIIGDHEKWFPSTDYEIVRKAGDVTSGPNPNCRYCRGTGMVELATSSKRCLDC